MKLTPHFTYDEAACHDGTPLPSGLYFNALRVAEAAEVVRAKWNLPIGVTSWYRTLAHNAASGGADGSMHLWALAMDLTPPEDVNVTDFWQAICDLAARTTIRGIGYAAPSAGGFVHIDCRPSAVVRHWRYPL